MNWTRCLVMILWVSLGCIAQDLTSSGANDVQGAEPQSLSAPAPQYPVVSPTTAPLSTATLAPVDMSLGNRQMYVQRYESGAKIQLIGRIMSWTGLALGAVGYNVGNSSLAVLGSISTWVGISLNGSGSSKMVDASNALNPAAKVEHRGWIPYWAGMVIQVGGYYMVVTGVNEVVRAEEKMDDANTWYELEDAEGERTAGVNKVGVGILVSAVGSIFTYVAWYKFSASADDAKGAFNAVKLSAGPLLVPELSGDGYAKGAQLSLAF